MTKLGDTKWDKHNSAKKPIGDDDKRTIVEYYEVGLKTGKPSEALLEELDERYGRSPRQILRYIRQDRELRKSSQERLLQVPELLNEIMRKLAQVQPFDLNHVGVSRKRSLAEVMEDALADVPSNEIYSVTDLQARILKSPREQRVECLRESLGGIDLTQPEEEALLAAITKGDLTEKLRAYSDRLYRRIRALERYHNPFTTSDVKLIEMAIETDDDQFNEIITVASYNEKPDYNADVVSAATKLLLDIREQLVLADEIEKGTRRGSTKEAATTIAQGRMELAKRLAASWFPPFIRTLARTPAKENNPATRWVQVENG